MIYSEQITCDSLPGEREFSISRQRNKPTDEWYGLTISLYNNIGPRDFTVADNLDWINELLFKEDDKLLKELNEIGKNNIGYTKKDVKHIRKLVKKARKFGWL